MRKTSCQSTESSIGENGTWGRVDQEACCEGWREFGSDCGVCLAVCPYSGKQRKEEAAPGTPDFLKNYMIKKIT